MVIPSLLRSEATMTETTIKHAENFTAFEKPVPRYGPWGLIRGQSPSGYGRKIPTDYIIRFNDDPKNTAYRVYCCIYSNVDTLYVNRKNDKFLVVRDTDLQVALGR